MCMYEGMYDLVCVCVCVDCRYGGLQFSASAMPYSELYHGPHQASQTTKLTSLSDYIRGFTRQQHDDHSTGTEFPCYYIFDGQILHRNPSLAADAPLPEFFSSSSSNLSVLLHQFLVGPKGSGSPPHFHGHALNLLVYGVKRWYLWPPAEAHFDLCPVWEWQEEHMRGRGRGGGEGGKWKECVQLPGDVVFVPEGWGHAVVNTEHSIAVAYEFTN